jgi:hypothetical protein
MGMGGIGHKRVRDEHDGNQNEFGMAEQRAFSSSI